VCVDLRVDSGVADRSRFRLDLDNPEAVLGQVEDWFSDLPEGSRLRRHVVRAVIRTFYDEAFDDIHKPTDGWRRVLSVVHEEQAARTSPRRPINLDVRG